MTDRGLLRHVGKTWPWMKALEIDRAKIATRVQGRWTEDEIAVPGDRRELTRENLTALVQRGAFLLVLAGDDRGTPRRICFCPDELLGALAPASCSGQTLSPATDLRVNPTE